MAHLRIHTVCSTTNKPFLVSWMPRKMKCLKIEKWDLFHHSDCPTSADRPIFDFHSAGLWGTRKSFSFPDRFGPILPNKYSRLVAPCWPWQKFYKASPLSNPHTVLLKTRPNKFSEQIWHLCYVRISNASFPFPFPSRRPGGIIFMLLT